MVSPVTLLVLESMTIKCRCQSVVGGRQLGATQEADLHARSRGLFLED